MCVAFLANIEEKYISSSAQYELTLLPLLLMGPSTSSYITAAQFSCPVAFAEQLSDIHLLRDIFRNFILLVYCPDGFFAHISEEDIPTYSCYDEVAQQDLGLT